MCPNTLQTISLFSCRLDNFLNFAIPGFVLIKDVVLVSLFI